MGDLIWALMDDCEEEAWCWHSGQGLSWSTGAASEAHSWGWGGDKHTRDREAWWETTAQLWAKVFTLLRLQVPWKFLTSSAFERTKGNSVSSVSCSLFILIQMNSIILTLATAQETIGLVLLHREVGGSCSGGELWAGNSLTPQGIWHGSQQDLHLSATPSQPSPNRPFLNCRGGFLFHLNCFPQSSSLSCFQSDCQEAAPVWQKIWQQNLPLDAPHFRSILVISEGGFDA